ncbi:hypothetical protein [Chloroflexus sp.]|uniref:hypothetical protein n=1 Tax=Chloroflexus sp. TaxID=1904827 RepID=UPI0026083FBA|nr:hypothetical protein [uncultured Chloroflexus sp.]
MTVYPNPTQPPATGWLRWTVVGVAILLLTVLLSCMLFGFGGWRLLSGLFGETQAIEQVVMQFMAAGLRNDSDTALALFADSPETTITRRDLERLFADRQRFRAVSGISITQIRITSTLEGSSASISGRLNYVDGSQPQPFSARLLKENDRWRLTWIDLR